MTAKDDDDRYEFEDDETEEARSIFSATWFRVVLATVGVGVIAAVALPYLLGGGTPAPEQSVSTPPPLLDTKPAASLATSSPPPAPEASGPLVTSSPPPPASPPATATPRPEPPVATPPSLSPPAPAAVAGAPKGAPEVASARRARPAVDRTAPRVLAKRPAPRAVARARGAAPPSSVKGAGATRKAYWVQVGTFKDRAAARRLAAKLRGQKHAGTSRPVTIADTGDRLSRVRVGPFTDRATAATAVRRLQAQGFKPLLVGRGA
jgi:DedD protein